MFRRPTNHAAPPPIGADESLALNPVALAEQRAGTPMVFDDTKVPDQDGTNPPRLLREEVGARNLGQSAADAVLAAHLTGELADVRSSADAGAARWEAERQLRVDLQARHAELSSQLASIEQHVDWTVSVKRRVIALAGKPMLLLGDTATFANVLYRGGTPIGLALLAGLSTGATLVAAGSQCGKEMKHAQHRAERGAVDKEHVPRFLHHLFDDADRVASRPDFWLQLAGAASLTVLVAFTALGISVGDRGGMALAVGLLAALTVVGSASLEAYGANEAADVHHDYRSRAERVQARLEAALAVWPTHAGLRQEAHTLMVGAQHEARSVAIANEEMANRLLDTPAVGGYLSGPRPVPSLPSLHELTPLTKVEDDGRQAIEQLTFLRGDAVIDTPSTDRSGMSWETR